MSGIPNSFAATRGDARESDTITSGLNAFIISISASTCLRSVNDDKNGPMLASDCLKSTVPSGLTTNSIGGTSTT